MAFVRNNQIFILELGTLKEKQITFSTETKKYPLWTKDGSYIIYGTSISLMMIDARDGNN